REPVPATCSGNSRCPSRASAEAARRSCMRASGARARQGERDLCYAQAMERIVHVCNGDSTADTLSLADLPGDIRVWADALDIGPVLPVSDADHYRVRGDFWASHGRQGAAKQLEEWDRGVDEAAAADELILWFEHDLFDQLALIRLLA